MDQPGLNGRHRDRDGEISRKHGDTKPATLRKTYGSKSTPGPEPTNTLADVLATMEEPSLTRLVHDRQAGSLPDKIGTAKA